MKTQNIIRTDCGQWREVEKKPAICNDNDFENPTENFELAAQKIHFDDENHSYHNTGYDEYLEAGNEL